MVERVADEDLNAAAETLRGLIEHPSRPHRPAFIGMGNSGHADTSARADEILRETGFGE